jgi:MFS family permease
VTSNDPPDEPPSNVVEDAGHANEDDLLRRPSGTFAALRYRNLRLIWIGQTGHAAALWMEQIARPWLVLDLTDDNPTHLGGVIAIRVVPQLLFGVWAGVIADRVDRKTLLQSTKIGVFILNVAFASLLVSGHLELWHVYAAAFLRGIFMSFDQPARQSLIADAVPAALVTNAVALMSSTQNLMRIIGVMMSGLLIGWFGLEGTFITIAVVYFVSVAATQLIDIPPRKRDNASGARGIVSDLMEGFRYAAQAPAVRGVLMLSAVFYGAGMMWMQVFAPLFARTVLASGPFGFGALVAAGAAGTLLGSLLIATRPPPRPGWRIALSITLMGGALMVFAVSPSVPGALGLIAPYVALLGVGFFHGAYIPLTHTILLTATPEHLRGRVISLVSLDRAMTTIGAGLGGLLAAWIGAQGAQFIYGAVTLAAGLAIFTFAQGLREYRLGRH